MQEIKIDLENVKKYEYKEILRLKEMLEKANIPFLFTDDMFLDEKAYPSYLLVITKNGERLCNAIEHKMSYGNENDLLEIRGGLTIDEQLDSVVLGCLTAEEVFKRFKYCYEHNTQFYIEE